MEKEILCFGIYGGSCVRWRCSVVGKLWSQHMQLWEDARVVECGDEDVHDVFRVQHWRSRSSTGTSVSLQGNKYIPIVDMKGRCILLCRGGMMRWLYLDNGYVW